jgi:putative molybdopterin biosynthesis protein
MSHSIDTQESPPLQEVLSAYLSLVEKVAVSRVEQVAPTGALGRVTAEPVFSRISSPADDTAAMSGYAVRSASTREANAQRPQRLNPNTGYSAINTGDVVTKPFDAIIKEEEAVISDEGELLISAPFRPGQNIRVTGEDFSESEMILPSHHTIRPTDIGLMLSGGVSKINVAALPIVAVIGADDRSLPQAASTHMIAALVQESGCRPKLVSAPNPGQPSPGQSIPGQTTLGDLIASDTDSDLVLLVSMHEADVARAVAESKGQILYSGVAVRPGKPVLLAIMGDRPVISLPAHPRSAFFCFNTLVRPVLELYQGMLRPAQAHIRAELARLITSPVDLREYINVSVSMVHERIVATPLTRGSGLFTSLTRSDGFIVVAQGVSEIRAGDPVDVVLHGDPYEIQRTLLCVGILHPTLDILSDLMPQLTLHAHLRTVRLSPHEAFRALCNHEAHLMAFDPTVSNLLDASLANEVRPSDKLLCVKGIDGVLEFLTLARYSQSDTFKALIKTLESPDLAERLLPLGSYRSSGAGKIEDVPTPDRSRPFVHCRM